MPLVYADSSALFAYLHPADEFSDAVDKAVRRYSPDFVYWPFLRFELRHVIRWSRTDKEGEAAWRALRAAEKTAARLRWQSDLTADKMLDAAEDLSSENSGKIECGATDYIHVAIARRMQRLSEIDEFWTCDVAQSSLAKKSGLTVRLFN